MASTKGSTAPAGTSQPLTPDSINSGCAAMYVLMTGRPRASASKKTPGKPSAKLGNVKARAASSSSELPGC